MENVCVVCLKPKANLECGACHEPVCKKCAQFLEEGSFSFLDQVPKELQHSVYCVSCYDQTVAPALAQYEADMEKAKGISIFMTSDSKMTQKFSRKEKAFEIKECEDENEVLMRLAFLAFRAGFNALVDVEVKYEKVKPGGSYQTTKWSGKGIPTQVTSKRFL